MVYMKCDYTYKSQLVSVTQKSGHPGPNYKGSLLYIDC
jgi:hypothetical protein